MTFKGYCPEGKAYDVKEHCISVQKLKRCAAGDEETDRPSVYKPKPEQKPYDVIEESSYDQRVSVPRDYYAKPIEASDDEEVPVDAECENVDDGDYPDPSEECADHYYSCSGGRYIRMPCAPGTMFDKESGKCDHPMYVRACGGQPTEPTEATTIARDEVIGPKIDCSRLEPGDYANPYEECSGTYFSCVGIDSIARYCQESLVYDPELGLCNLPEYVTVCGGYPTQPTETPYYPIPESEYDCSGKLNGAYYPDPDNQCSNLYYSCVGGHGTKHWCATENLRYDPELEICELEEYVPVCGGYRTTPAPPTDSNPIEIDRSYSCKGLQAGNYPADTCAPYYWACAAGAEYGTRVECAPSTYYDELEDDCAFYNDVYSCSGLYRTTTSVSNEELTTTAPYPYDCPDHGNFPVPDYPCSNKYVACSGPGYTGTLMRCAAGMKYDVETDACYPKREVPACGGQHTTKPPSDATPPSYGSYYRPAPEDTPDEKPYKRMYGGYKPNVPYRRRR
jgi:hypothetical protein